MKIYYLLQSNYPDLPNDWSGGIKRDTLEETHKVIDKFKDMPLNFRILKVTEEIIEERNADAS